MGQNPTAVDKGLKHNKEYESSCINDPGSTSYPYHIMDSKLPLHLKRVSDLDE